MGIPLTLLKIQNLTNGHMIQQKLCQMPKTKFLQMPTIPWMAATYFLVQKAGYDDVTEAVDKALHKLPAIAQRSTGSFCTPGFETGCMSYGNNT